MNKNTLIRATPESWGPNPRTPELEHPHAKVFADQMRLENMENLTLPELKALWAQVFEAMKKDGCTGFHATPNTDALDKLPNDHERERHWLIGVMGMLGASLRGEYEDVTEILS